jgi:hypothetical protein
MKPSTVPMICGLALAATSAAGFSHWWSVRSLAALIHAGPPAGAPAVSRAIVPPANPAPAPLVAQTPPRATPDEGTQKKFFEGLIAKMEALNHQNRDLLDQVAETNRDVMKLEFRVDTHSESFRPMPVNEEQATSFEDGPGVLPPRAEPVFLPSGE